MRKEEGLGLGKAFSDLVSNGVWNASNPQFNIRGKSRFPGRCLIQGACAAVTGTFELMVNSRGHFEFRLLSSAGKVIAHQCSGVKGP
jgi:hypothetical protein